MPAAVGVSTTDALPDSVGSKPLTRMSTNRTMAGCSTESSAVPSTVSLRLGGAEGGSGLVASDAAPATPITTKLTRRRTGFTALPTLTGSHR